MNLRSDTWGPDGHQAALAITFDHLGEAAELQAGLLPAGTPVGDHPSITRDLPRLLHLLRDADLASTFYVEAWNCSVYPKAVEMIVDHGHRVGWHAWWNEPVYALSPRELSDCLERSVRAFDGLGLQLTDARPPGGRMGTHAFAAFAAAGFRTMSLAGDLISLECDIPVLPFDWRAVDAGYYLPSFARLRGADDGSIVEPCVFMDACLTHAARVADARSASAFVFHVPLLDTPSRVEVVAELIVRLRDDGRFWLTAPDDIYAWITAHADTVAVGEHTDGPPRW